MPSQIDFCGMCFLCKSQFLGGWMEKWQMVMNCRHKGAAALLIASDKCKWIYIHLPQNCVWWRQMLFTAVAVERPRQVATSKSSCVSLQQFQLTHCLSNETRLNNLCSQNNHFTLLKLQGNQELIKTVLDTEQNSAVVTINTDVTPLAFMWFHNTTCQISPLLP